MSLISENVIPGNHGKTFIVDITEKEEFEKVREQILKIEGVEDVLYDDKPYPHEIKVHSSKFVKIKDVQNAVRDKGFHAVPAGLFEL